MNVTDLAQISSYNVLHDYSTTTKAIATDTFDKAFNATTDNYKNATNLFDNLFDENSTHIDGYTNHSIDIEELLKKDHVFDRTDVRVIFITMYTLVFCCCFFGKSDERNKLKKFIKNSI